MRWVREKGWPKGDQHTPFLNILTDTWPATSASRISPASPPLGPRGRAGELGRRGKGWPCLGGLLPRPLRRRHLATDPAAGLRVICSPLSQWEGVTPARSFF